MNFLFTVKIHLITTHINIPTPTRENVIQIIFGGLIRNFISTITGLNN